MKARIVAVLLTLTAAAAPLQSADAGPILDALRNRAGQAVFLGKVAKAHLIDGTKHFIKNRVLPCFRNVC
jgi:hypothetical protein